jgi:HSP20 family protein
MNELASMHSTLDRLFSDAFGDALGRSMGGQPQGGDSSESRMPTYHLPVDVVETEDGYRVRAPVPGFKPEDVEVTFSEGVLTIRAERKEEKAEEEGTYHRREVAWGHYQRQIALPGDIQADKIEATFDNGMLTIEVPRAPKPEPMRIQIHAGNGQAKHLEGGSSERQQQASSKREAATSKQG